MKPSEVRIAALDEGENAVSFSATAADLGFVEEDELVLVDPVSVDLTVVKVDDTLDIRGTVHGSGVATCSRCAGEASIELDLSLRLIGKERPADEAELVVDSEDLVYHDGYCLDLADAIRQILLVSVPMAPLCSEACRGLCPVCGTDLNTESCTCERKAKDPRWQALDELLEKERGKS